MWILVKYAILEFWILSNSSFSKCEFCQKCDLKMWFFFSNEISRMWILSKMWFSIFIFRVPDHLIERLRSEKRRRNEDSTRRSWNFERSDALYFSADTLTFRLLGRKAWRSDNDKTDWELTYILYYLKKLKLVKSIIAGMEAQLTR